METYDVIILGGGPAGLTAALYSARYNLKTLTIMLESGGTTNLAHEIENWPGFLGSGRELMKKFREQAELFGAKTLDDEVISLKKEGELFEIKTRTQNFFSKSIIISLGSKHRELGLEKESEFLGKGMSYCATCDGNFFRNKIVAVVGGANSAATAALYLSTLAQKVYIIYRKEKMRCEPISLNKLERLPNVEFVYNATPLELIGEKKLSKLKVEISQPEKIQKEIELDGIFVEIGSDPLTQLAESIEVELDKTNYIKVDKEMKTSIKGVFAAGDITNNPFKQAITAAGEGAIAANSVYEYLKDK